MPAEADRGPGGSAVEPTVPVSRAGRLWVVLAAAAVLLIVILVFIFQNLDSVEVHFITLSGSFPLALALLFAVILGALVVLCVGSVRIVQLRRTLRRRDSTGRRAHH